MPNRYIRGPVELDERGRRVPVTEPGQLFPFHGGGSLRSVNDEDAGLIVLPAGDKRPLSGFPNWTEIDLATYIAEFTENEGRAPEAWEK